MIYGLLATIKLVHHMSYYMSYIIRVESSHRLAAGKRASKLEVSHGAGAFGPAQSMATSNSI